MPKNLFYLIFGWLHTNMYICGMIWNVWVNGVKINRHPLNEEQARKMAKLHRFNYGSDAKPIKAWKK